VKSHRDRYGLRFVRVAILGSHFVKGDVRDAAPAFLRAEMAEVVAEEMLEHAEQPGAQLAGALLGHVEGLFRDEAMKKGLREIFRVLHRMAAAAQVGVNGIPVACAQLFHRLGRLVGTSALHGLDERPVRGGEGGIAGRIGLLHDVNSSLAQRGDSAQDSAFLSLK
jgi:hypothetical protein